MLRKLRKLKIRLRKEIRPMPPQQHPNLEQPLLATLKLRKWLMTPRNKSPMQRKKLRRRLRRPVRMLRRVPKRARPSLKKWLRKLQLNQQNWLPSRPKSLKMTLQLPRPPKPRKLKHRRLPRRPLTPQQHPKLLPRRPLTPQQNLKLLPRKQKRQHLQHLHLQ